MLDHHNCDLLLALHFIGSFRMETFYKVYGNIIIHTGTPVRIFTALKSCLLKILYWLYIDLRRLSSQIKNAPPMSSVTIPIGISSGAIKVRARMSAQSKNIAPMRADARRTLV